MSRFTNKATGVTVSVDDAKDHRYADGQWEPADKAKPARKASAGKKA